jgi:hypothetical protein
MSQQAAPQTTVPVVSSRSPAFWVGAKQFVRQLMWPSGHLGKLGRLFGGLSFLGLTKHTFGFGLGPTFELLLNRYEFLLSESLGRLEPFIQVGLAQVRDYISWPLVLYGHWKHVFVLLGIYFFREVGVSYQDRGGTGGAIVFNALLGLIVALVFSVATGSVPISQASPLPNFMVAAIPMLGAVVYGVVGFVWESTFLRHQIAKARSTPTPTWWGYFSWGLSRIFTRTLVGLALLWIGLQIPLVQQTKAPGIAMLTMLVVVFALYWLCDGISDSKDFRKPRDPWWPGYLRSPHTQLGLAMLGTFSWFLLFVLMSAGLGL